jgi:hypothetical protein
MHWEAVLSLNLNCFNYYNDTMSKGGAGICTCGAEGRSGTLKWHACWNGALQERMVRKAKKLAGYNDRRNWRINKFCYSLLVVLELWPGLPFPLF